MLELSAHRCSVIVVLLAALVPGASDSVFAQTRYPDVTVLVVGDDEDPGTLPRSHAVFKSLVNELKGAISRAGFPVIDEEAVVVADQEWEIRDRRPKGELISQAKDMNTSGEARHRVRELVLLRIEISYETRFYSHTPIEIKMAAEVVDVVSNRFIDSEEKAESYMGPPDCNENCVLKIVDRKAKADVGLPAHGGMCLS